jgi:glutathione S-transferase
MSESIVFYHHPQSRGRTVHWMLEEAGAPYEVKLVRLDQREHKSPEYLAINPMGKVPAIVHRGTVVTETAAICAYIADALPQAHLAPRSDDPKRGTYLRWLFFCAGCLEPALIDRMFARPQVERPAALGYGNYEDTLNAMEKALAPGPYVLGEDFSAADVYIGSTIGWCLQVKSIEPRPAFLAYVGRCAERAAHQRMVAQNEAFAERLKKAS